MLIDRRDASWSNVKQVLTTLQGCKLELSSILVIRPGGLHRIISEATVRFLDLGFAENTNVKFLKSFDQALAHIEPEFISTVSNANKAPKINNSQTPDLGSINLNFRT